jgi:hypothetical protein
MMKTTLKPRIKAMVVVKILRFDITPDVRLAREVPEMIPKYPGAMGNIQGERNESNPPAKAIKKVIPMGIPQSKKVVLKMHAWAV